MTKVLLVEDDAMNRDMLSRRLQRKGLEVDIAVDGGEAVEKSIQGGYDIVLMDMSLPVMDGYEATRQLRARAETRELPIIGLSAHAMVGDREKALLAGCNDYDTKPVDFARLISKISALLAVSTRD
ncbi:MAG: response regulator [Gammaproteobacteria bacterium]|nr:response regulator [Gammaproteobacteria bacterium]